MARTEHKKVINGNEWTVWPWDGMHGIRMQARIAPLIKGVAGPVGNAVRKAKGTSQKEIMEALLDLDIDTVVNAIFQNIDDQKTPQLIRDMMHGARVNGNDMSMDRPFNEHFAGNYAELYQGLWFILEVNFGELFSRGLSGGPVENGGK